MSIDKPMILGVITARGGSKGIPGKNIKVLGNKPLIAYTIDVAKKSTLISHLIVSTDDEEIAMVARQCGGDVPFMRPKELAQDTTPHLPVLQHALAFVEKEVGVHFDCVVILQPTSPFRTATDLDGTIRILLDSDADSAVSIVEVGSGSHPIKMKKLEGTTLLPYCIKEIEGQRRQDLPIAYKRSGAVYAIKRNVIMEQNRLYGDHVLGYVVPAERSIDIDEPFDWIKTEYMLEDLKKKGYEF